jgi:hypothetical protein
MTCNRSRVGMRKHRHRRLALYLPAGVLCGGHINLVGPLGLVEIKLSMILDNLIVMRHDCFVTKG